MQNDGNIRKQIARPPTPVFIIPSDPHPHVLCLPFTFHPPPATNEQPKVWSIKFFVIMGLDFFYLFFSSWPFVSCGENPVIPSEIARQSRLKRCQRAVKAAKEMVLLHLLYT